MAIPPLVLRIYADSSGVKKGVAQAQTQVSGLRASIAANANLIKVGLAAAVVGGFAVATKAAGDLGEAQNAVNVTFGKSSGIINEFAKGAATSAGLAEAEALQAAAGFGAMFDSAGIAGEAAANMAVEVSQLAADVGSLRNADPTDMLERMRAGLAGEAEPLRRFGIFLSEARVETEAYTSGIANAGEALTDAQKIQARYNIILQDSEKASGDFARTAGTSLPNQLRILRAQAINLAATFGKVLLPAVTTLLRAVNFLLTPLTKLAEVFGTGPAERFQAELEEIGLTAKEATARLTELEVAMRENNASGRQLGGAMSVIARQERAAAEEAHGWAMRQKAVQAELDRTAARTGFVANAVRRFTNVTEADWDKWVAAVRENFDAVGTALGNLADKTKLTADKIIHEFRRQAKTIRDYRSNLEEVAQRDIPDAILQQLLDMGIDGAKIIEQLATVSDRKFNQIVHSMQAAGNQARGVTGDVDDLKGSLTGLTGVYPISIIASIQRTVESVDFRQHGGPVLRSRPYIVGEKGPELFVPGSSGHVVPNGGSGRGTPLGGSGRTTVLMDRKHYTDQADYEATFRGY